MPAPRNIFLIGPMGSGKSAVGRRLAKEIGRDFYDSDDEIENRTGVDIEFIFEKEGESGFRQRECKVIEDLTQYDGIVLATGGGAAQDPQSRNALAGRGTVIYLHATVEQQLERTRKGRVRPMLSNGDPASILKTLMETRDPQYREIADMIVETDGRRVSAVAREIVEKLDDLKSGRGTR
jgi:shikimate kinase